MNSNIHSLWHVGGTSTPSHWTAGDTKVRNRAFRSTEPVPDRATSDSRVVWTSAESCGNLRLAIPDGTKWHARPCRSSRVHGSAS